MKLSIEQTNIFFGFTLAEVLITLGIIGIVAAMTLPVLTNKIKHKEYETQFKVAENLIHNAVNYMHANNREIYGTKYCTANTANQGNCNGAEVFSSVLAEAFTGIRALNKYKDSTWGRDGQKYMNYTNTANFAAAYLDDGYMELKNGMTIMIESGTLNAVPIINIDINGPQKKPNRFGYDVFSFVIDKGDKVCPLGSPACQTRSEYRIAETLCSKTSNADNNGITCGYFASTDKDYFKNLE